MLMSVFVLAIVGLFMGNKHYKTLAERAKCLITFLLPLRHSLLRCLQIDYLYRTRVDLINSPRKEKTVLQREHGRYLAMYTLLVVR